jgi:hypothetical protein
LAEQATPGHEPAHGQRAADADPQQEAQRAHARQPQTHLRRRLADALEEVAPTERAVRAIADHPLGEHHVGTEHEDRDGHEPPVLRELRHTEERRQRASGEQADNGRDGRRADDHRQRRPRDVGGVPVVRGDGYGRLQAARGDHPDHPDHRGENREQTELRGIVEPGQERVRQDDQALPRDAAGDDARDAPQRAREP